MRLPLSPRAARLGGACAVAVTLAGATFGPVVRAVAISAAKRQHLAIVVDSVRPGWFAVRLLGVRVQPDGVSDLSASIDELRADLGFTLGVYRLQADGVSVKATAPEATLRDEAQAWRDLRHGDNRTGVPPKHATVVVVRGMFVRWDAGDPGRPRIVAEDISASWDGAKFDATVPVMHYRTGSAEVSALGVAIGVDAGGFLSRAHAEALIVSWSSEASRPLSAGASSPPSSPSVGGAMMVEQAPAADPSGPLLALPDPQAIRGRLGVLATLLTDRVVAGADVGAGAVTWKIERPRERVAFTIGPGPLHLARSTAGFDLDYSTDARAASTPLELRVALPLTGDPSISLDGGPVSLALLGVQEGAAGLVDVAHATVTGRARVILADDGRSLTFDGEGGARGLSLSNARIASDVVHGLDVQLRARGVLTSDGDLRLDEASASVGAIQIAAGGVLEQRPDHVASAFHFDVPVASCQSLLDSLPGALLPALEGTRIAGNFAAHGRFAFDSRSLDNLELVYDVRDGCRVTDVPAQLARERFEHAFTHRIYLPDGSTSEELTGPGTDNFTPLDEISPYMQVAVLTTEDGGFPKHHGFNRASIRSSLVANLKARRFVRGASTITMQLAKNLFLTREKTLSRKLEEVVLTDYLEQTFTKDELMELYLNVIEFGPAVYGITSAAEYYFGRTPGELNLGECLFLSSLLPAPLRYGAMRDLPEVPEGHMRTLRSLMQIAHKYGRISDAELENAQKDAVVFWHGGERPSPRPPVVRARPEGAENDDDATAPPLVPSP